jgi:hypothetical protein
MYKFYFPQRHKGIPGCYLCFVGNLFFITSLLEYVYKNKFFCCRATVRFAPPNK